MSGDRKPGEQPDSSVRLIEPLTPEEWRAATLSTVEQE